MAEQQRVEFDDEGVRIRYSATSISELPWSEVATVSAYAVDAITHMILYVEFGTEDGESIEAHDRMAGWNALLRAIGEHLLPLVDDIPAVVTSLDADQGVVEIAAPRPQAS